MLRAKEGDSTTELFKLDEKWYLTVDGEPANDGRDGSAGNRPLPILPKVMGEFEVIS